MSNRVQGGVDWASRVARTQGAIRSSVFVGFGKLPEHPDMISLGGGAPPVEALPIERLAEATATVWETLEPDTLYYGETEGYLGLRQVIARRMAARGVALPPDEVLITAGSQQGLDLAARALLAPGDPVIVEAPAYFGATQVFDLYHPRYIPVPVDEQGVVPQALEAALRSEPRPRLIYTVPSFQNPTGVSLAPERRQAVVRLARDYGVPIIEDDPYGELWFESDPETLRALDPDVIYLGTFSKTLAPALRMGWLVAPAALVPLLIDAKEGADIQSDRMMQRAVARVASGEWLDQHIAASRAVYRRRRDLLLARLEAEMPPGTRWIVPGGGFFVWVTLPGGIDTDRLLYRACEAGVMYVPGSAFYTRRDPQPTLRLGFTTLPEARLVEGVARLGRVLREAMS